MTTTPIRPEPKLSIDGLHLCITREWSAGHSQNVHLLENGDLGVVLERGQDDRRQANLVPHDNLDGGLVVLALGVDEDHDEVHYMCRNRIDDEELLGQAIEALTACRDSLARIRMAGTETERNAFELGRDYERSQQRV